MQEAKIAPARPVVEVDAVHVVRMAHELAAQHGDTATLRLDTFIRDVCGDNPRCHVFVIENENEQIAGFTAGYFTYQFHKGKSGYEIQNFFILPEFRRHGFGSRLIEDTVRFAVSQWCDRISLGAELTNTDALRFYGNLGFEKGKSGGTTQRFFLEGRSLREFMDRIKDDHAP